jgi:hypothetical protein
VPLSTTHATNQPSDSKLLVIAARCGRLANRLTLFANFVALAEEHGWQVINFTFHSYAHLFETTRRDVYCHYPVRLRRSVWDLIPGAAAAIRKTRLFYHATRGLSTMHERMPLFGKHVATLREMPGEQYILLESPEVLQRLAAARVVFIHGWVFRAPAAVRSHAEKVRAFFHPIQSIEEGASRTVRELRQKADVLIGVHLRQGDYRTWRHGKYFFEPEQYARWMRDLVAQFPGQKVAFLVCSDEPRNGAEFPGLTVGFGGSSAVQDNLALSKCDYLLGPVSSYSMWASFYGNTPLFLLRGSDAQVNRDQFAVSWLDEIPR